MTIRPGNDIKRTVFGIRFDKRGENDRHVVLRLLGEDDGNWFDRDVYFSSFWLDELIRVLEQAKRDMQEGCESEQWGYKFRE